MEKFSIHKIIVGKNFFSSFRGSSIVDTLLQPLLLKMPPAGQCRILKADYTRSPKFRILFHRIRQADICLEAPLEALSLLESYTWHKAERPSCELIFPVQRIVGICIYIVGVRFYHTRNLWPQPYNHRCTVCLHAITRLAVNIGHIHCIRISADPSEMINLSNLYPYACTWHYGPVVVQQYIQPVGKAQYRSWENIVGHAARLGKQAACNQDRVLQSFAGQSGFLCGCCRQRYEQQSYYQIIKFFHYINIILKSAKSCMAFRLDSSELKKSRRQTFADGLQNVKSRD